MLLIDPLLSKIIFICALGYTFLASVGYLAHRADYSRLIGVLLGVLACLGIHFILRPFSGLHSFGPSPVLLVLLMFVSIILGTIAEYLFSLGRKKFSWTKMLRPALISPILLFPLVGLLQKSNELNTLAIVSLLIVAFQNGFFWREMIEKLRGAI